MPMSQHELHARGWVDTPGHLHINAGDMRMVEGLLADIDQLRTALAAQAPSDAKPVFTGSVYRLHDWLRDMDRAGADMSWRIEVYRASAGSVTPTGDDDD